MAVLVMELVVVESLTLVPVLGSVGFVVVEEVVVEGEDGFSVVVLVEGLRVSEEDGSTSEGST